MDNIARGLAILVGAFMLFMGLSFWFALDSAVAGFAIAPDNVLGRASIRADVGGFFAGTGLLALLGAWKRNVHYLEGATLFVGLALAARAVSMLLDGPAPGGIPPMVIEAVMIGALLWARSRIKAM